MGTSHEDQYPFLIIYHSVLLRMKNVSITLGENKNRHLIFTFCWPGILQWFLVNDQRDAQIPFYVFLFIYNSTCFEHLVL